MSRHTVPTTGPGCHRRLSQLLGLLGLTLLGLAAVAGTASADDEQTCDGTVSVCVDGIDPQVGPLIGPNDFDLGGLFG